MSSTTPPHIDQPIEPAADLTAEVAPAGVADGEDDDEPDADLPG